MTSSTTASNSRFSTERHRSTHLSTSRKSAAKMRKTARSSSEMCSASTRSNSSSSASWLSRITIPRVPSPCMMVSMLYNPSGQFWAKWVKPMSASESGAAERGNTGTAPEGGGRPALFEPRNEPGVSVSLCSCAVATAARFAMPVVSIRDNRKFGGGPVPTSLFPNTRVTSHGGRHTGPPVPPLTGPP